MMNSVLMYIGWAFMFIGAFFMVTASLGVHRFPDFFTRLHAVAVSDSLGAPILLLGVACQYGFTLAALKIILVVVFLLITAPTGAYALANAAILEGYDKKVKAKRQNI